MKQYIMESANSIHNAVQVQKECTTAEAIKCTKALNITIDDVLRLIDEENITWLDTNSELIEDTDYCYILDVGYNGFEPVVLIEEYKPNLYNIYLDKPENQEPLKKTATEILQRLERLEEFIKNDIAPLDYCEPSLNLDLLRLTAEAVSAINEASTIIDNLD